MMKSKRQLRIELGQAVAELAITKEFLSMTEAERDNWHYARDRAVEQCRLLHTEGKTAAQWHLEHCGAVRGVRTFHAALRNVMSVCMDIDNNLLDPEAEIPVGEVFRMIREAGVEVSLLRHSVMNRGSVPDESVDPYAEIVRLNEIIRGQMEDLTRLESQWRQEREGRWTPPDGPSDQT